MLVLAQAQKGAEYFYNPKTAHAVSNASGEKIRDALNKAGYMFNGKDGIVWHLFDVSSWDAAGIYASGQAFKIYRGAIRRVRN